MGARKISDQDIEIIKSKYRSCKPIKEIVYEYKISTSSIRRFVNEDDIKTRSFIKNARISNLKMRYTMGEDLEILCNEYDISERVLKNNYCNGLSELRNFSLRALLILILKDKNLKIYQLSKIFGICDRGIYRYISRGKTLIENNQTALRYYQIIKDIYDLDMVTFKNDLINLDQNLLYEFYYLIKNFIQNISKLPGYNLIKSTSFDLMNLCMKYEDLDKKIRSQNLL